MMLSNKLDVNKDLKAPIKKGDTIGMLTIEKNGETLVKSPLVAKENVEEARWWTLFKRSFGMFTKTE